MIFQPAKSFTREFNEYASQGLQALANMKLNELQRQREYQLAKPGYEEIGLSPQTFYMPPTVQAQRVKYALENAGIDQMFRTPGKTNQNVPPTQPQPPQAAQNNAQSLDNMTYEQLASSLMRAPKHIRERFEPILNVKKEQEKRAYGEMTAYEKRMEPLLENIDKLNIAIEQARQFAKAHPDLYGPYEGRTPNLFTLSPEKASLRQERDRLNNTIVALSLPLEGSIGRGSNLMIKLKEGSKAAPTMSINDYLRALNETQQVYNIPVKQFQTYSKMREKGKIKEGFINKLRAKTIQQYKDAGAEVSPVLNKEELEKALGAPLKKGQTKVINGVEYEVVEE